jgi:hypothetical protein
MVVDGGLIAGAYLAFRGLPLMGKFLVGCAGVIVAEAANETAALSINSYVEKNYPHIRFRLTSSLVKWAKDTIEVAWLAALRKEKSLAKKVESMGRDLVIQMILGFLVTPFTNRMNRAATRDELQMLLAGAMYACR